MGKKKQQGAAGEAGEDGEEGDAKQIENWIDSVAGASALGRRRLIRVVDAGARSLLVYAGAKQLLVADCSTGCMIDCEQPHTERVSALASHDGKFMVTGGQDKKLVVWDLASMKVKSQTTTDKKIVGAVIDQSGTDVVFAEKAGEVFSKPIGDADAKSKHLLGHISSLTDMALSPSGQRLLTADRDEKIRISHYPHAFEIDAYCLGHTELVTCMCVFTGEKAGEELVLSAGADGTLRLWNVSDGALLATYEISASQNAADNAGEAAAAAAAVAPSVAGAEATEEGKKKQWDHMAAGTAEGTAAVSGRMRGKCQAAPVVALVQCGARGTAGASSSLADVFAVAIEHRREVLFVSIRGNAITEVGRTELVAPAVGLACVAAPGAAPGGESLLMAATFDASTPKMEACWVRAQGERVTAVAALAGKGGDADGERSLLLKTVAALDAAISQLEGEAPDGEGVPATSTGQDQYLQKRRRHTEPGWKDLHGKNPRK